MTPEEVLKRCDENTIGVVATLGVTFTGQYEPVKAVVDALREHTMDVQDREFGTVLRCIIVSRPSICEMT